jgi:hypothetical protein
VAYLLSAQRYVVPAITPPETPAFPKEAEELSFVLLEFDIEGLRGVRRRPASAGRAAVGPASDGRRDLHLPTSCKRVYVGAGYLLVRVVVVPQELSESARVKIRVIDGYIERVDAATLPAAVRVAAVFAPLLRKGHLRQSELERRLLLAGDTPGLELSPEKKSAAAFSS